MLNGLEPWACIALGPENKRVEAFKRLQKSDQALLDYVAQTLEFLGKSQRQEVITILETMLRTSPENRSLIEILKKSRSSSKYVT
jgi:hypothetical protein